MVRPDAPSTTPGPPSSGSPRSPLVVTNLSKARSGRELWKDVTVTFDAGTTTSIVGPSGVGKSTFLQCLGLLETTTSGSIAYEGSELSRARGRARRRLHRDVVGFLFQDYGLVDSWTVAQNLDVALTAQRVPSRERAGRRSAALRRIDLEGVEATKVSRLSGGEQQRVALARLVLHEPRVVLADEPTAALDDANAETVLDVLRELADDGAVVIVATHDLRLVAASERVLELDGATAFVRPRVGSRHGDDDDANAADDDRSCGGGCRDDGPRLGSADGLRG
ncbi:ATP-binding cassette domain-containing protein [Frigoribacterium sp. VKM Ac-2836]|nr:ATP-binding cassette domain-containing protein [Frigoribacterium sp. VKM Ac-2836]NRD26558.1 ATP-binding cassette domain-containing protein [Frigoribacterium sp. VKM Ac-2836]